MSYKVTLHVYDLSQGLASQLSMGFIGKQIDGIWHTGLAVYDKEYYFGGGICSDPPAQTPFGNPTKKIEMGETEVPKEVFMDFLKEVNHKFTIDTYDLFENNCNNFTDACCEFLLGKGIPEYITGLPKEVLATPFGMMIKPFVDSFTTQLNQNSHPMPEFQTPSTQSHTGPQITTTNTGPHPTAVLQVNTIEEFFGTLDSHPGVIVDFFSYSCPPCVRIKPFYEQLASEYLTKCPQLRFVSVNTQVARDIAMQFQITAIPTFIGFYDAMQIERFSGADQNKITALAKTLEGKINASANILTQEAKMMLPSQSNPTQQTPQQTTQPVPQGPSFKVFNPKEKNFMRFEGEAYAMPVNSIRSLLDKHPNMSSPEGKALFQVFAKDPQGSVKGLPEEEKRNLVNWILDCVKYIEIGDKSMGFIDLLKMLCLDKSYAEAVVKNSTRFEDLWRFFDKNESGIKEIQKGLRLMLIRLLANVTAHEETKEYFLGNFNSFSKLMINVARACKDEKTTVQSVVTMLWNISQNLAGNKEFEELAEIVTGFLIEKVNSSAESDVILPAVLNLALVCYWRRGMRSVLDEKLNIEKLEKLATGKEEKLAGAVKDLLNIIEGKI